MCVCVWLADDMNLYQGLVQLEMEKKAKYEIETFLIQMRSHSFYMSLTQVLLIFIRNPVETLLKEFILIICIVDIWAHKLTLANFHG
jgi:hypothetical protein